MAMIAPEKDQHGRGKNSKILEFYEGGDRKPMQEAVRKARVVLRRFPELAKEVVAGRNPTLPI